MADDPEAARIQRERERRTAVERLRIDRERLARQTELARLERPVAARGAGTDRGSGGANAPGMPSRTGESPIPSAVPPAGRTVRGSARPEHREIGGSIPLKEVEAFLQDEPLERFDLVAVNTLELPKIAEEARRDPSLLEPVADRAETLMVRVKRELDDPLSAGAFLRDQTVLWYERSETDAAWTERMPQRWGGLFAESRSSGGRTVPWINARLSALRDRATREGKLRGRIRRKLSRDRATQTATGRTAAQQINAEVVQSILDDMASHPRDPETPLPLVRLSELAVRRQVATVNDSLAMIFSGPESGPFVVLHPNRYPRCEELLIRPPGPGASGAALAFTLAPGRPLRKVTGRLHPAGETGSERGGHAEADGSPRDDDLDLDASTLWEARSVSKDAWAMIVTEAKRARTRLDPPPKDYRTRAAFAALRALALEDAEFRKSFLSVKWRGRPSGLPLLVALLQKGTLAPEVATDHEYLEAELGELVQGDPDWRPSDFVWVAGGWRIVREGSHAEGLRYRAERAGA
ncbi:MAG TPA: hypothetical protein VK423_01465 [Thermoplasmata archaeon]|nr:hypothetical protein [Thermoplasmata archaeon]